MRPFASIERNGRTRIGVRDAGDLPIVEHQTEHALCVFVGRHAVGIARRFDIDGRQRRRDRGADKEHVGRRTLIQRKRVVAAEIDDRLGRVDVNQIVRVRR